jgi:hypothetical protein
MSSSSVVGEQPVAHKTAIATRLMLRVYAVWLIGYR